MHCINLFIKLNYKAYINIYYNSKSIKIMLDKNKYQMIEKLSLYFNLFYIFYILTEVG